MRRRTQISIPWSAVFGPLWGVGLVMCCVPLAFRKYSGRGDFDLCLGMCTSSWVFLLNRASSLRLRAIWRARGALFLLFLSPLRHLASVAKLRMQLTVVLLSLQTAWWCCRCSCSCCC